MYLLKSSFTLLHSLHSLITRIWLLTLSKQYRISSLLLSCYNQIPTCCHNLLLICLLLLPPPPPPPLLYNTSSMTISISSLIQICLTELTCNKSCLSFIRSTIVKLCPFVSSIVFIRGTIAAFYMFIC